MSMKSALTTLLLISGVAGGAEPSLIPWPAKITSAAGSFTIDAHTKICASSDAERAASEQLQAVIKVVHGLELKDRGCDRPGITLKVSQAVTDDEGYTLDVSSTGVRIEARAPAGLYYGAMTAAQLLSGGTAQSVHIEDSPRFKWRGLMLDSARHFSAKPGW